MQFSSTFPSIRMQAVSAASVHSDADAPGKKQQNVFPREHEDIFVYNQRPPETDFSSSASSAASASPAPPPRDACMCTTSKYISLLKKHLHGSLPLLSSRGQCVDLQATGTSCLSGLQVRRNTRTVSCNGSSIAIPKESSKQCSFPKPFR